MKNKKANKSKNIPLNSKPINTYSKLFFIYFYSKITVGICLPLFLRYGIGFGSCALRSKSSLLPIFTPVFWVNHVAKAGTALA